MLNYIRSRMNRVHTTDLYPPIVPVKYDSADEALPEAAKIAKRLREYILAQNVALDEDNLFTGYFRFDGTVPSDLFPRTGHTHFGMVFSEYYNKPQENLVTFEWQHSTPDYRYLIEEGLEGYLRRIEASKAVHKDEPDKVIFLEAMAETCRTMIAWAEKCADACKEKAAYASPDRAAELREMAAVLRRVPRHRAETFREAIQSVFMGFNMLSDSIGTADRYLRRCYEADLAAGRITREKAGAMLQELFLCIQSRTPIGTDRHNWGGECHFAIGGYLPDGTDGFCDLSKLIVESILELDMDIPEISLRWTKKTPPEVLRYMLDCERHDRHKRIAFVSDEPRIRCFTEYLGLPYEDAVNYTMVGCNEPAFQGSIWFGGNTVNICRCLVNTLYEHSREAVACRNFEEFYRLFYRELAGDMETLLRWAKYFNERRSGDVNVLSSILLDGCIENGRSATQGGCRIGIGGANLMGLVSLADSLSVIRQFVYDEKTVTMEHLISVLRSDWTSDPELRTRILKTGHFHGNADPKADEIMQRVTDSLYALVKDERLNFGQKLLFGTLAGYNPHYVWFGNATPATPDGRRSGEPFLVGSGQANGRDREGLTALFTSVAHMQPSGILCGPFVCNVMLDEKLVRDDDWFERTVKLIEAYFRMGGMHVQLNYVSRADLLAAREEPEKYRTMKTRVSGFSGYFVTLKECVQDEIIARTSKTQP